MRASIDRRIRLAACPALAAACVVAGLAGIGTAAAQPNTVVFETTLGLANSFPAFHGYVRSERNACEENRKVKVFKWRQGPDRLIGSDRTNKDGRYFVDGEPLSSGGYYASVGRREEGTAGTTFVCTADKSPIRVVD